MFSSQVLNKVSEERSHVYETWGIKNSSIKCKLLSLTHLRDGLINEFELIAESASVIVSVVLGEHQHISQIELLIEVKLKGSLEAIDVPSTDINAILLQVGHQVTETIEVVRLQRLSVELVQ